MRPRPSDLLATLPDVAALRDAMGNVRLCLACIVSRSGVQESRARQILSALGEDIQLARLSRACSRCREWRLTYRASFRPRVAREPSARP